jgi:hypothetical protein
MHFGYLLHFSPIVLNVSFRKPEISMLVVSYSTFKNIDINQIFI